MDEVRTKRAAPKTMAALLEDDRIEPVDKLITAVLHFITGGLDFCDTESEVTVWYEHLGEPMRPVSRKTEVELPNEETLENAVLYQKVHCCGLAEVLIPLPESTQSPEHVGTLATVGACGGGIAVNTPIQRIRFRDLLHNVQEKESTRTKSETFSRDLEKEYLKVLEDKNTLVFSVQEVEAIRCEAEESARNMESEIDQLRQTIQDYGMQTNDLSAQLSQLTLELRLIELTVQANSDTDNDIVIQSILNEMKAEIKKEETELGKLRDVNEKLKREEELDDIRRTKYEMELKQLEEQIALETMSHDYDYAEEDEDTFFKEGRKDNRIYGFAAPSTALRKNIKSNNSGPTGSGFWRC